MRRLAAMLPVGLIAASTIAGADVLGVIRADDGETRKSLLDGIKRIAANVSRANDMPEGDFATVRIGAQASPVTTNDPVHTARMRDVFVAALGKDVRYDLPRTSMYAEDFSYFYPEKSERIRRILFRSAARFRRSSMRRRPAVRQSGRTNPRCSECRQGQR